MKESIYQEAVWTQDAVAALVADALFVQLPVDQRTAMVAMLNDKSHEAGEDFVEVGFVTSVLHDLARENPDLTEKDYDQALDNLVNDSNCDYRLAMRNVHGGVLIINKHTNVGSWFDNAAQAADHILGEEPQVS